jgi:hypothetical protein
MEEASKETDPRGTGFDAFLKYEIYTLTLSNILSNFCLSLLVGSNLFNEDGSSFSILSNCLNKDINLPL